MASREPSSLLSVGMTTRLTPFSPGRTSLYVAQELKKNPKEQRTSSDFFIGNLLKADCGRFLWKGSISFLPETIKTVSKIEAVRRFDFNGLAHLEAAPPLQFYFR